MGLTNFICFFLAHCLFIGFATLRAGFDHIVKAELGTCDVRECVLRVSGFVVVFTGVRCMGPPKKAGLGGFWSL